MFKRRRRSKKREAEAIGTLFILAVVLGVLGFIFQAISTAVHLTVTFLGTTNGKIFAGILSCIVAMLVVKKVKNARLRKQKIAEHMALEAQQLKERQKAIESLAPSANRNDYIIEKDDYRRGSPKENYYRKTFALHLLEVFNNSCAKCGSKENGVDIDHFMFSKNEGGCFIMRHKDGHLINNAIPLCQTCNRSKSDEHYKAFFTDSELLSIFETNVSMTKRLNEKSIFTEDGSIIKQKKVA